MSDPMSSPIQASWWFCQPLRACALSILAMSATQGLAVRGQYHPDHPKVQAMVDKGMAFLHGTVGKRSAGGEYASGEKILVGYTALKVTGDIENPTVKAGIAVAVRVADSLDNLNQRGGESKIVYEASIASILLATADAAKYRPQLEKVLYWLEQVQKPHGGFGYLVRDTGDTSQVQYVVLALWTMQQAGVDVPPEMVEDIILYLKATMDPSGGWGYQGKLGNGQLVKQTDVSKSLGTAGVGAVIIAGDILGFYGLRKQQAETDEGIPAAFVRADLREKIRAARKAVNLSRSDTDGMVSAARRYLNTTRFSGFWYFYWRYSQERYESFVEIVENKQNKSPAWYNEGVLDLEKLQSEDGSWGTIGRRDIVTSIPVKTAFAVLFLIRSTQKAIGKLDEGIVRGGYGLPTDVSKVRMVGNRIVSDEEMSVQSMLEMLEEEQAAGIAETMLPDKLKLSDDPGQRRQQVTRLARLLSGRDPQARRVAAKLLGRSEDLDQVPELIFALSDSDPHVPMIAEEGLRLLSRKLTAGKLGLAPSEQERQAAEEYWKQWYLGLRPDYVFLEQ